MYSDIYPIFQGFSFKYFEPEDVFQQKLFLHCFLEQDLFSPSSEELLFDCYANPKWPFSRYIGILVETIGWLYYLSLNKPSKPTNPEKFRKTLKFLIYFQLHTRSENILQKMVSRLNNHPSPITQRLAVEIKSFLEALDNNWDGTPFTDILDCRLAPALLAYDIVSVDYTKESARRHMPCAESSWRGRMIRAFELVCETYGAIPKCTEEVTQPYFLGLYPEEKKPLALQEG